jgi:hypothetical protein
MKNSLLAFALALTAGLLASPESHAQAASSTAIVSVQTNQCWDVQNYSQDSGAIIQMYTCTGTTNQLWAFRVFAYNGNKPVAAIVNVNSGLCASAESTTPNNGVIGLVQRPCNNTDGLQQFTADEPFVGVVVSTGGSFATVSSVNQLRHITNVATNWCLRTEDGFNRPVLESSCGAVTENRSRFRFSVF